MDANNEKVFANGLRASKKADEPDWVVCSLGVKVDEFIQFIREHEKNGWTNLKVKMSKAGNMYAELDSWTKDPDTIGRENVKKIQDDLNNRSRPQKFEPVEDDIPF